MRVNNELVNRHIYSAGVSGSGKTYFVMKEIKKAKPQRLLIWDAKREMADGVMGAKKIHSIGALYSELVTNKKGRYIFVPKARAEYQVFCALALAWANTDDGDLFVYIEEAGGVSGQGKSKDAEYNLITQGRALGIIICYVSQGFAGSSTTAFQNIDSFRVGRQKPSSIKYIRDNLSAELAKSISQLKDYEAYLFNQKTDKIKKI